MVRRPTIRRISSDLQQRRLGIEFHSSGFAEHTVCLLLTLAIAAATSAHGPPAGEIADVVILDGRIWTGVRRADPESSPVPTAVAIRGDRIRFVGNDAAANSWIGERTRIIHARGRRMIPGISDSHTHIISGGLHLARLNLRDVRDREEFVKRVADAARSKKSDEWVVGGRWSVESWPDSTAPNRSWLDPVTGETPAFLTRMDGHQALVNTAALKRARIDAKGPPDPPGGEIERDPATGEPTGVLKESAMNLVSRMIPSPSADELDAALKRAMEHANSLGVTSVHNMTDPWELEVFRRAHAAGRMTVRVTAYLSVSDWHSKIETVRTFPVDDDWLRVPGFKGYMDGSLGSRTAYMRDPYSDAGPDMKHPRGQLNAMADPPEKFREAVAEADAAGLQLAVHAIGDQANHLLLDAFEYAARRNGSRDRRHRIEHVQHLLVPDIPRFSVLGVVASMQPFHKADDGRYAERALGRERLAGSYAFRALVDAGATLVFGSDFPVVTLNPWQGIDAAVSARTLSGELWLPEHSLTIEESLLAYTAVPPRAIHREDRLGTIEPGKLADLLILAADPFSIPPESVGKMQVWQTIVGGRIVYAQPE
jgi:predicted amidohydrolase YtcJ